LDDAPLDIEPLSNKNSLAEALIMPSLIPSNRVEVIPKIEDIIIDNEVLKEEAV
jgi:hypothetical protein